MYYHNENLPGCWVGGTVFFDRELMLGGIVVVGSWSIKKPILALVKS